MTPVSLFSVTAMATDSSPDPLSLAGRTALVTGGGSGIGAAVALALAEYGMDVLVTGRRANALARTAAQHPAIRTRTGDVSDPADTAAMVEAAVAGSGRLDLLVNNAGFGIPAPLGQIDPADALRMWATTVLGPTLLTQAALTHLSEVGGAVVNVSSTFGSKPAPRISHYGAGKAALEHLTRSWALELAERGIRVNAIAPGPTESEALLRMRMSAQEIDELKAEEAARIPLGRRGLPEDVVPWVVALARPGSWVTGQVIGVDGGYVLA